MAIDFETYKKIADNTELTKKLEKLWNENASATQLLEALQTAGISVEASQVETFLAELQEKRASVIALDEIDDELLLKKVAGGASDEENFDRSCQDAFFCYQNVFEQCTSDFYVPCNGYSVSSLY